MECLKQNGKRQDDNNKDVRVLAIENRKVATITINTKPVVKKPLTVSIRGLTECTKQCGSKQVDNDEEIIATTRKTKKVAMTTRCAKPMG